MTAKRYLTISEFAGLRDININSLHYYEKLKILTPAWVDPKTKYRYYLPEQLCVLDIITLCILLGIPLKDLQQYIDENGQLAEKEILESGKEAMQKKIAEMQKGLELIEFNLSNMKQNQEYHDKAGVYTRRIEERFLLEAPFSGNWNDLNKKEKAAMDLFHDAQNRNMVPVFPAGILVHCGTTPFTYSFFVQVLHPAESDGQIVRIPAAEFLCLQASMTSRTDIEAIISENFPAQNLQTAIIANMPLNKASFNSRHSEIQVLADN